VFIQSEDAPAPLFRSLQLDAPEADQQQQVLHSLGIFLYLNGHIHYFPIHSVIKKINRPVTSSFA